MAFLGVAEVVAGLHARSEGDEALHVVDERFVVREVGVDLVRGEVDDGGGELGHV